MAKPNAKQEKEIGAEVKKLVDEYERTGEIKTSRAVYKPKNHEAAIKQALAIEYGKHHVGRAGSGR